MGGILGKLRAKFGKAKEEENAATKNGEQPKRRPVYGEE